MIFLAAALIQSATLAIPEGMEPQIVVGNDGSCLMAYGSRGVLMVARSGDGKVFERSIPLSSGGKLSLGMRRGPRIARSGETVTVTAVIGEKGGGADGDIRAFFSRDNGRTWQIGKHV